MRHELQIRWTELLGVLAILPLLHLALGFGRLASVAEDLLMVRQHCCRSRVFNLDAEIMETALKALQSEVKGAVLFVPNMTVAA